METLNVGTNVPIKLKVQVQTEAIPSTYTFLYHTENDTVPYHTLKPFNPSMSSRWKTLSGENPVNGKVLRVTTSFSFFNTFPNEETFNLAIKQIKETYTLKISGGNPSPYEVGVEVKAFYEDNFCIIRSALKFN